MANADVRPAFRAVCQLLEAGAAAAPTDRELLERFARHREETAFATLLERHGAMVLGVCRRVLADFQAAEDAFQATFLVLARKAGGGGWHDSVANWLHGVALRAAFKMRAQLGRGRGTGTGAAAGTPAWPVEEVIERAADAGADPEGAASRREIRALLDEELARLPERCRAPLVLCYLEGKTNEEAAQVLGLPVGSMSRHLGRARDRLRERLVKRGIIPAGGGCALWLGGAARASPVPAALHHGTLAAGVRLAAGQSIATIVSPYVADLVEGVLRTMVLHQVKWCFCTLLVLGLIGLGAGGAWYQAPAVQGAAAPLPAMPAAEAAPAGAAPAGAAQLPLAAFVPAVPVEDKVVWTARDIRKSLAKRIDLDKGIEANTPLKDALEFIVEKFDLPPILIDSKAFEAIGVAKVEEQPVSLPRMRGARVSTVLRLLLSQIRGDTYHGSVLVRPDGLEITTTYQTLTQGLGNVPARFFTGDAEKPQRTNQFLELGAFATTLVQVDFDKRPLNEALRELAEAEGINVVIDPRTGDKGKLPVTLTLNNVAFETAVRLLADMAELKVVAVNNVFYVTTEANAKALRAEQERLRPPVLPAEATPPPQG